MFVMTFFSQPPNFLKGPGFSVSVSPWRARLPSIDRWFSTFHSSFPTHQRYFFSPLAPL